jgi:hypothetical protein
MNDIEKSALIVTNTIKEIIILFLAMIITLNYCINFIRNDLNKCEPTKNKDVEKYGILNYIQDIIRSTINEMMNRMKCYILNKNPNIPSDNENTNGDSSNGNSEQDMYVSIYYGIFIVVLYLFFNMKNVNNNSWNDISNDFFYKLIFIVLFPMFIVISISLLSVLVKITFSVDTIGAPYYVFIKGFSYILFMMILLIPIPILLFENLYYLIVRGKHYNLMDSITGLNIFLYVISFIIIFVLCMLGFFKMIRFNFNSTFLPFENIKYIQNKLKDTSFDTKFLYIIVQLFVCITILYKIKDLFSFELFIFGVIVSIIFTFLILFYDLMKIKN